MFITKPVSTLRISVSHTYYVRFKVKANIPVVRQRILIRDMPLIETPEEVRCCDSDVYYGTASSRHEGGIIAIVEKH